jgi:3-hydroxyisobutyrate dehydrogenase-like beta-hydroxyacid dehydrogenase
MPDVYLHAAETSDIIITMLDAPVSGREPKAIDGTVAIMVGGPGVDPEKVFQAIRGGLAGSTVLDAKMPYDHGGIVQFYENMSKIEVGK